MMNCTETGIFMGEKAVIAFDAETRLALAVGSARNPLDPRCRGLCRGSLELRFGFYSRSAETGEGFEQRPGPLLIRRRFEQACERGERHDASPEHPSCCIKRAAFLVGF